MRKVLLFVLAMGIFLWQPEIVYADNMPKEFLSLEELNDLLKSGPIEAYFKTVPENQDIKYYDIFIKGVYKEPGIKIIIFTTMHKIAAGMSGSPVYVKSGKFRGKVVGAAAYSVNNFAKVSWGGISPSELMHRDQESKNISGGAQGAVSWPSRFFYENNLFEPIALGGVSMSDNLLKNLGVDEATARFLKKNKFVFSSGGNSAFLKAGPAKLVKPGMPIMVDLASWLDQNGEESTISVIGTITYVDKKTGRVYAFGHPFLGAKKVKYAFRSCSIMGIVPSEENSFKISGESSDVVGLIDFDSVYGIYGKVSSESSESLHVFNLDLQKEKQTYGKFKITVADHHAFTPLIASVVLSLIGETNGAPLPQEVSMTELASRLDIWRFSPVYFNQVFSSSSFVFGDRKLHNSSYEVAVGSFISGVYTPVFFSRYGFKIENVWLTVNFVFSNPQELKFASTPVFPEKVIWGESPLISVELVSEDNSIALEKVMEVKIDWDKVQKPVYSLDATDFDKEDRKRVWGSVSLANSFVLFRGEEVKGGEFFDFYLNAEDFLNRLSRRLKAQDGKFIGWVTLKLKEEPNNVEAAEQKIMASSKLLLEEDWRVVLGGLKERKVVRKDNFVNFRIDFPPLPSGYVISSDLNVSRQFEVLLKEER